MSEATTILGKILASPGQRDAIHIAVAPVTAAERLRPGQHVGFVTSSTEVVGASGTHIGIVDPFLTEDVLPKQRFFMCLYPNTITSLRHEWTHPAFGAVVRDKSEAERWLTEFAEEFNLSYKGLIAAAKEHLKDGRYKCLGFDTPDRAYTDMPTLWKHFETVTGLKVDDHDSQFFECAC